MRAVQVHLGRLQGSMPRRVQRLRYMLGDLLRWMHMHASCSLLGDLNQNFSDPGGVDPFKPTSSVIPQQAGAYTGGFVCDPVVRLKR